MTELEQRVGVYIDNSRSQVRFYAALPDGREVIGAAFEHVEAAIRWCIRDTYELDWQSFIHIKRVRARVLHLHVASLFADDGTGRKFLAARLLDGLPLFGSTNLLGGPSGEST